MSFIFTSTALSYEYPNPDLTPGEVLTTETDTICVPHYSETVRNTSKALKDKVYEKYGITTKAERKKYVLDHLINLALGGADTEFNLWPQPKEEAKNKDVVENYLKRQVCKGKFKIEAAQDAVAEDWAEIYSDLQ